mmetsp:Transcript_9993/g.45551  ORF Transcript_9993/g.45551 Transcript_9993/m.45551 type:complete len:240 (+) Transcript_9993:1159-1878(+)
MLKRSCLRRAASNTRRSSSIVQWEMCSIADRAWSITGSSLTSSCLRFLGGMLWRRKATTYRPKRSARPRKSFLILLQRVAVKSLSSSSPSSRRCGGAARAARPRTSRASSSYCRASRASRRWADRRVRAPAPAPWTAGCPASRRSGTPPPPPSPRAPRRRQPRSPAWCRRAPPDASPAPCAAPASRSLLPSASASSGTPRGWTRRAASPRALQPPSRSCARPSRPPRRPPPWPSRQPRY